ncbi:MAG: hypothetical protein GF317_22755 [Candidatus Lokiarchaeota archaeon]|nr:hypothetical protein [Candidatus Lokiarchaeota archaeon]
MTIKLSNNNKRRTFECRKCFHHCRISIILDQAINYERETYFQCPIQVDTAEFEEFFSKEFVDEFDYFLQKLEEYIKTDINIFCRRNADFVGEFVSGPIDIILYNKNQKIYFILDNTKITEDYLQILLTIQAAIEQEYNIFVYIYTKDITDYRGLKKEFCINTEDKKKINDFFIKIKKGEI